MLLCYLVVGCHVSGGISLLCNDVNMVSHKIYISSLWRRNNVKRWGEGERGRKLTKKGGAKTPIGLKYYPLGSILNRKGVYRNDDFLDIF